MACQITSPYNKKLVHFENTMLIVCLIKQPIILQNGEAVCRANLLLLLKTQSDTLTFVSLLKSSVLETIVTEVSGEENKIL